MRYIVPTAAVILLSCGEPPVAPAPAPLPSSPLAVVQLAPSGVTVVVTDSVQVRVVYNNVGETEWSWSSGTDAVATVNPAGWVRGLSVGNVAITACAKHSASCGSASIFVR